MYFIALNNFICIKDTMYVLYMCKIQISYRDIISFYVLLHNKTLSKNKNMSSYAIISSNMLNKDENLQGNVPITN